ncbi:hypothetical protein [Bradyrhizobium zhanjiangense]|uniref:Uncharacterized protein n=1 Tax=Bradyrhizobium zhanjiangense TaxID=1325107 RepID=A0A4Q0QP69_9BRAD|nr:hypothetical protein [Bradyrhizobium zhanjiangense]RXG97357.1 hypothetical protein EAS61_15290 [Bradyrhizobium zhanjiangense]
MDWKKELDALLRETAALVERTATANPQPAVDRPKVTFVPRQTVPVEAPSPAAPPLSWDTSEREHITKRIQNFRAHQERIRREREDFYSRTMQRARDLAEGRLDPRS